MIAAGRVQRGRRILFNGIKNSVLVCILFVIVAPSVIMLIISFSNDPFIKFPPRSWGVDHYGSFLKSDIWPSALWLSLEIAMVVTVVAVLVGTLFVFGLHRTRLRRLLVVDLLVLGPIIVPGVAYAVAMFSLQSKLHLLGTRTGIVVAHVMLTVPFVVLIVGSAISRIPRELEYAAMSLGATRGRAHWDVTLRMLSMSIAAAAIFSFITSFDEPVFVSFLAGPGFTTLPLAIFQSLQFGVDPAITAIAALLIAGTGALTGLLWLVRRSSWYRS